MPGRRLERLVERQHPTVERGRRVPLQQRARGHEEEGGVDAPQEHADERHDLRLGARGTTPRSHPTRSSPARRSAVAPTRSPTTASSSPVSTRPTPKTVCSNANIASVPPSTSRTYERLEHAERRPEQVHAAGDGERPTQAAGAREPVTRRRGARARSTWRARPSARRGTGSIRMRNATSAPTRNVAASAKNAPSRPQRALTAAAASGPTTMARSCAPPSSALAVTSWSSGTSRGGMASSDAVAMRLDQPERQRRAR